MPIPARAWGAPNGDARETTTQRRLSAERRSSRLERDDNEVGAGAVLGQPRLEAVLSSLFDELFDGEGAIAGATIGPKAALRLMIYVIWAL